MTKRERERIFLDAFASLFADDWLLPVLLVIWIMVVGTVAWAIDREGFEFWFPAVVFVSGLLIAVGESVINWLRRR